MHSKIRKRVKMWEMIMIWMRMRIIMNILIRKRPRMSWKPGAELGV